MSQAHYSVIRYIPDPGRGESLNVGILLWDESAFRVGVDAQAIERVIRENPLLERDSLLYVEPLLSEQLSESELPLMTRVERLLSSQRGFPIDITDPRFTTITDDGGLDATLDRVTERVVRPKRRARGSGAHPAQQMERRLKRQIATEAVARNHFFGRSKTGVPRKADFFANSGNNVALDVIRLAIRRADEIRIRADAEAFKVYDVLEANSVADYFVFCEFGSDRALEETNENARTVMETQGAKVLTDLDEATTVLMKAASFGT